VNKEKVLFVCIHNSARSQMAEELLRKYAGDRFEVASAGIEPGRLNPFVIKVLQELDIDITGKKTQKVADLVADGREYDYVITVCDEASAERCPVFPGIQQRMHWGFVDPSGFKGTDEERMNRTREVREQIRQKIKEWMES